MGLHVRVRHALGERVIELPERSADDPIVIGRSKDADVKIPSVTVSTRHAALFVHEGRWLAQDLSKGGTFVNDKAISGPTALSVGDVLRLGNDASPATIEIDPAGVSEDRTGEPVSTNQPAPKPQARSAPPVRAPMAAPAAARMAPPQPFAAARPKPPRIVPAAPVAPPVPPAVSDDPWGATGAQSDDPFAGWGQPNSGASAQQTATTPRRRKKQSSSVGLVIGVLACIAIVGGTIWAVRYELHQRSVAQSKKIIAPLGDRPKGTGNIFTGVDKAEAPPSSATATPKQSNQQGANVAAMPKPSGDRDAGKGQPDASAGNASGKHSPDASADPKSFEKDKDWNDVIGATYSLEIGQAILKFDDYRRQHPGIGTKELDDFEEEAMDRLWWKRIGQLCARRDARNKDLRAKDKELKEQPDGAFKKTLMDERKVIQDELDRTQARLASDMGYTNPDAPDPDNKEMMTKLTDERDASKYGAWKISTRKFIRNNHGATPWDGEN